MQDAAVLRRAMASVPRLLVVNDLQVIPRAGGGMLVTADLPLPAMNMAAKRRQLRLGTLPG